LFCFSNPADFWSAGFFFALFKGISKYLIKRKYFYPLAQASYLQFDKLINLLFFIGAKYPNRPVIAYQKMPAI
jgi:hypothetical protein